MKPVYWAIIWGDNEKDKVGNGIPAFGPNRHPSALRTSYTKYEDPQDAAKECFGTVSTNMWVKNLGSTVAPLRSDKKRAELLDIDKGEWMRLGSGSLLFSRSKGPVYWVDGKFESFE
jgi:hypothetical protein